MIHFCASETLMSRMERYTNVTAAALRAKESVMTTVTCVLENAGDILADAKAINEERAAAEAAAVVEDEAAQADCACGCAEAPAED